MAEKSLSPRLRRTLLVCDILAVAAELHGHKETLHLTSPKRWFENIRSSFTCGR